MKIFFVGLIVAVAILIGNRLLNAQRTEETMSDFAKANVEALADDETNTSWYCDGWWGTCSAYCGSCGTKIDGDGSLRGSHSCSRH